MFDGRVKCWGYNGYSHTALYCTDEARQAIEDRGYENVDFCEAGNVV